MSRQSQNPQKQSRKRPRSDHPPNFMIDDINLAGEIVFNSSSSIASDDEEEGKVYDEVPTEISAIPFEDTTMTCVDEKSGGRFPKRHKVDECAAMADEDSTGHLLPANAVLDRVQAERQRQAPVLLRLIPDKQFAFVPPATVRAQGSEQSYDFEQCIPYAVQCMIHSGLSKGQALEMTAARAQLLKDPALRENLLLHWDQWWSFFERKFQDDPALVPVARSQWFSSLLVLATESLTPKQYQKAGLKQLQQRLAAIAAAGDDKQSVMPVALTSETYYDEKHTLLQSVPTETEVRTWMLGSLAYIEDTESWLVRMRATGWQPLPKAGKFNFPFATHSSGSSITQVTTDGKTVNRKFSDILLALKDTAVFDACRYSTAQFLPYFKELPPLDRRGRIFNTFNGWMHAFSDEPITAEDPDVKRVNDHLWDLCGKDAAVHAYVLQWLASILQQPQRKMCVLVFYSVAEGVGKNMLQDFLQQFVFGPAYVKALQTTRSILGNFNTATEGRLLTSINECKEDSKSILDNDQFKSLITDANCDVNGKFQAEREIQNFNKYMMLTNNKHSCQVGKGRRFTLIQCSDEHAIKAPEAAAAYFKQLSDQILNIDTGCKYFQYLAQMDLSQFVPTNTPNTGLKADLKRDQMTSALKHVVSLVEEQRLPHILTANWTDVTVPVKTLYSDYREWCRDEGIQPMFVLKQSRYKEQLTDHLKLPYGQFTDANGKRVCGIRFERSTLASAIGKAIMDHEFAFDTGAADLK